MLKKDLMKISLIKFYLSCKGVNARKAVIFPLSM